jgi:hypothetical protein
MTSVESVKLAMTLLREDMEFKHSLTKLVEKHLKQFETFGRAEWDPEKFEEVVFAVVQELLWAGYAPDAA